MPVSECTGEHERERSGRGGQGIEPRVVSAPVVRAAVYAGDTVVRVGLLSFLRRHRRLTGIDTATSVEEADVAVVAVEAADGAALRMLRELRAASDCHVLLVVKGEWTIEVSDALDHGVRAMLWHSDFSPAEFTARILSAARGGDCPHAPESHLTSQIGRHDREAGAPTDLPAPGATDREKDVLRLLAEGRELAEIAAELCYSERTIKYVLHKVMKRAGLRNRAHAVSYAIRNGLI
ncbi:helix-turn-helix transcriptional regulator [Streptantibioticus parmotrematis]|uniref:helix-turn-helix transcriptional regulator n=1 Tax=Streptantibioticus parmotrematis TaxID=2873249 RepID=UPI0027E11BF2|nr:response regulator transcription factor [Streptantibioticus parmotrematis]